jgi:hypothetical protein
MQLKFRIPRSLMAVQKPRKPVKMRARRARSQEAGRIRFSCVTECAMADEQLLLPLRETSNSLSPAIGE